MNLQNNFGCYDFMRVQTREIRWILLEICYRFDSHVQHALNAFWTLVHIQEVQNHLSFCILPVLSLANQETYTVLVYLLILRRLTWHFREKTGRGKAKRQYVGNNWYKGALLSTADFQNTTNAIKTNWYKLFRFVKGQS